MQKVIPAILTNDPKQLQEKLTLFKSHTNWFHIDVVDGIFAPNTTCNLFELGEVHQYANLEIHLMVQNPEKYFEDCRSVGAKRVVFHAEATKDLTGAGEKARSFGFQMGIAINLQTEISVIESVKNSIDSLLLMSIVPGFQGQEFIPSVLAKTREARKLFPEMLIGVDGGIGKDNIKEVFSAGASYAVVGSKIMKAENPIEALRELEEMVR